MDEPVSAGGSAQADGPRAGWGDVRWPTRAVRRAGPGGRGGHQRGPGGRGPAGLVCWALVPASAILVACGAPATRARTAQPVGSSTRGAWSGYVLKDHSGSAGGPYSSVGADFRVPQATCTQGQGEIRRSTGFWVGIQGAGGAIVQTGFEARCNKGQPGYIAWHAHIHGRVWYLPLAMQAGDYVYASVTCQSRTCSQTVQDVTQNWEDVYRLEVPRGAFPGGIAAVAGESSPGGPVTTTPAHVTNAIVNSKPIGHLRPEADEQNPAHFGGTAGLDPTQLDPGGTSFNFQWNGNPGS